MYCSITDVKNLLPPSVTIGQTNIGTPSPGKPTSNRDALTPEITIQYIRFATQEVDSRLRPFYVCPLRRVKTFETELLNNISSGQGINIKVHDSGQFAIGDTIRVQEEDFEATNVIAIPDMFTITVDNLVNNYSSSSLISVIKYPDPIPLLTARLTVSYAFDKLFASEQSPDISQYGIAQRKLASNDMDSLLSGTILLTGQDHTGRRFVRGSLFDAYKSPTEDFQFGREKE